MRPLRLILVGEGPSDDVLEHPVRWSLDQRGVGPYELIVPDTRLWLRGSDTISARVGAAIQLADEGPTSGAVDVLRVHRDSDGDIPERRREEIRASIPQGGAHVAVVPIRETEAWLLFDEAALREASGNPRGRVALKMPALDQLERLADPKRALHELLLTASEASGRRRDGFRVREATRRLASIITDWSPLRRLDGFRRLEDDLARAVPTR